MASRRAAFGRGCSDRPTRARASCASASSCSSRRMLVTTNVIGAAVVAALSLVIIPGAAPNRSMASRPRDRGAGLRPRGRRCSGPRTGRSARRALRWVPEGRAPSDRERQRALQLPWRLSVMQLMLWALALAVFTPLAVDPPAGRGSEHGGGHRHRGTGRQHDRLSARGVRPAAHLGPRAGRSGRARTSAPKDWASVVACSASGRSARPPRRSGSCWPPSSRWCTPRRRRPSWPSSCSA